MNTKFKPTQTQIHCAETVCKAIAFYEVTRKRIEPRQQYVLELIKAVDKRTGEPVRKADHTYLMADNQFKEYLEEMRTEFKNLGYTDDKYIKDDYCPLLVAQDMVRQAKQALIISMEDVTGLPYDQVALSLDVYDKYIELTLRLLAPYLQRKNQ